MWGGRGVTCKAATCYSMFLSPWPPNSTSPQGTLPLASGVAVFAFGRREKSTVAGAARGSLERLALQTHGKTPWWQGVVPKRGAGIPGRSKRKPDKMTASPTAAAQMLRERLSGRRSLELWLWQQRSLLPMLAQGVYTFQVERILNQYKTKLEALEGAKSANETFKKTKQLLRWRLTSPSAIPP
eukprot:GHVT01005690.1.p1 GENE.GHVT01005690.1~~GHVT01005690.1.p1  ORF type:complete len:184 (+),score=21.69 GHVT01005690.1:349-900(+)